VARTAAPVELQLGAVRRNGQLVLTVGNEAKEVRLKPDPQQQPGEGVGLANVARRLENFYGSAAGLSVVQRDGRFTVELRLPIELTL
jgi:LytS/YehU family sensor histidine kinase